MNSGRTTINYGKRIRIARDRWVDDTRTDRLALALEVHNTSRWGAALTSSGTLSSSGAR